ncbi:MULTISPECIES: hypothetical protein [Thiothrix]|uniref:Bacteriocin n=2 Tax=Thiothrix TaxID=1030 RepID=A0AA51MPZ2_9GAMM|nr:MULTISPECIES: hypothetical protein [Thiothrix]MDQ5767179.1 hypothetical protein [Thiothrix subterranea]UJS24939.1 hypothetical protein L2Y54_02575 [Thiothrix winogradskyi]WML87958.1 hypothetical protein RCG00_06210 [Thiothrix subterranea]
MKFVSSVAVLLILSSAATYADSPDILNSVPQDSVQVMSKNDAGKLRGGYKLCVINPRSIGYGQCTTNRYTTYQGGSSSNGVVSKTYQGIEIGWFGSKYYVAR